jgi:hypothetical protein
MGKPKIANQQKSQNISGFCLLHINISSALSNKIDLLMILEFSVYLND